MQLHADAVMKLVPAGAARRPALLASETKRVQIWLVRRAYRNARDMQIAILRSRPGDEEGVERSTLEAVVAAIVGRLREKLRELGVGPRMVALMMSSKVDERGRCWAVLVGESRFDVLHALSERLPNVQVIGSTKADTAPEKFLELVDILSPVMDRSEEDALLETWEHAAFALRRSSPRAPRRAISSGVSTPSCASPRPSSKGGGGGSRSRATMSSRRHSGGASIRPRR
jgi:hypothetical protein